MLLWLSFTMTHGIKQAIVTPDTHICSQRPTLVGPGLYFVAVLSLPKTVCAQ